MFYYILKHNTFHYENNYKNISNKSRTPDPTIKVNTT